MGVYKHTVNISNRKIRARKFKRFAIFFTLIFLIGVGVIFVDWILNKLDNKESIVTTESMSSVRAASISVYRTNYYQFQAPEEWVFVSSQSTDKKFVYLKNDGALVTQRLVVIIDRPVLDQEADMPLTNVLPVTITSTGRLQPLKVSEHCGESEVGKNSSANQRIVLDSVSFVCSKSSKKYNIVIGEVDGNEALPFDTSSNGNFTVTLIYSDLTAYPNTGDVYNIVETFEIF